MKTFFKILKRIGLVLLILPIAFIILFIVYEVIGAVVNEVSTDNQTNAVVKVIEKADCEIIDTYSFTGNSSGTGNHVDMLTLVIVRTENLSDLEADIADDEYLEIEPLPDLDDYSASFRHDLTKMDYPEDTNNCYLIWKCCSAPFSDNIMGH